VREAQPGDLLVLMSNGSFDGLCDKLTQKLEAAASSETALRPEARLR